jgi:hypothetical protein
MEKADSFSGMVLFMMVSGKTRKWMDLGFWNSQMEIVMKVTLTVEHSKVMESFDLLMGMNIKDSLFKEGFMGRACTHGLMDKFMKEIFLMAANMEKEHGSLGKIFYRMYILDSTKMIRNAAMGSIFGRMGQCIKDNSKMIKGIH